MFPLTIIILCLKSFEKVNTGSSELNELNQNYETAGGL
jgi:hypothetical protein